MMNNLSHINLKQLEAHELLVFQGGGPIEDGLKWYYRTVGSFYRGVYDGLMGNEPYV